MEISIHTQLLATILVEFHLCPHDVLAWIHKGRDVPDG